MVSQTSVTNEALMKTERTFPAHLTSNIILVTIGLAFRLFATGSPDIHAQELDPLFNS